MAQEQPQQPSAEVDTAEADIKLDVKPPKRLATSYLSQPGLLRMLGAGDEDHIITKVLPGTDPLQQYDKDDPSQLITIEYETDESSDVDDLSVVSMGLEEITNIFDKSEVRLILATGVRKYHEYQSLKGKREEKDIISYRQLQKKFRSNKRTLMECAQGYKYQYPGGVSTKVPFTLSKPKEEEEETPSTTTTVPEAAATSTPATSTAAETSIPTTTT